MTQKNVQLYGDELLGYISITQSESLKEENTSTFTYGNVSRPIEAIDAVCIAYELFSMEGNQERNTVMDMYRIARDFELESLGELELLVQQENGGVMPIENKVSMNNQYTLDF